MIAQMPIPIEGELFFSTLCRLYKRLGSPAITAFGKVVLGNATRNPGTTIPLQLDYIETRLPYGYTLTAKDIRKKHSLQPFILDYVAWSGKRKYMVDGTLKSCPECRKQDTFNLGYAIWRTIHQVEGIHYCMHHQCQLEVAVISSVGIKTGRCYTPNYSLPNDMEFSPIQNLGGKETHLKFLALVQDVLECNNIPWKDEISGLWGEMERQGYTTGRHVEGWNVIETGYKIFGSEMQSLFGIPNTEYGRRLITNVLTEEDPNPHRILFLHMLLNLPLWKKAKPAIRSPIDFRPKRASIERVPKEKQQVRKEFLKLLKASLPNEHQTSALYQKLVTTDSKWLQRLQEIRVAKRQKAKNRLIQEDPIGAEIVRKIAAQMRNSEGCPQWIRKNTIIKLAGNNARIVHRCKDEPLTSTAFKEVAESQEDIIRRRIEWAKSQKTANMAEYEFKSFAKLRGLKRIDKTAIQPHEMKL